MIDGHGDDAYRYGGRIRTNFSSNIYYGASHHGLKAHLADRLDVMAAYPEPYPYTLGDMIARHHGISADSVLVTSGATDAIYLIAQAFRRNGERACYAVHRPTFSEYDDACRMFGYVEAAFPDAKHTACGLYGSMDGPNTMIWLCNPNNPTGYLYTMKEMLQIRDLVKKYDLFLFSDEVYREFIYTGSPYISACHLEGIEQNVVLIDSVSKRYSECGIRIGALITKNKTLRNAVMKFCQARLSPPLLGQLVAEASIDAPRSYSTEVYEEYIERRKCLIDGLNRIPGVYSPIPMGAFYTVARLPVDDSDKFCAWCLSEFSYENETVMLAPASGFYSDPSCGRNEVRIAYVLKKEDLERALFILRKALEAYNAR